MSMAATSQLMYRESPDNRRHSFGVAPTSSSSIALDANLQMNRSSLPFGIGGPIRRTKSKTSLFNENVIEVSILKSPARKAFYAAPPAVCGNATADGLFVEPTGPQQTGGQVTVLDALIGCELAISLPASSTVGQLKTRIQSRQGQNGLRIIPAHVQRLTFRGEECHDTDMAWVLVGSADAEVPPFVLEPRVNELVSFFLSSVSNLAGPSRSPKVDRLLSPPTRFTDAAFAQRVKHLSLHVDDSFFGGEAMEMEGIEQGLGPPVAALCEHTERTKRLSAFRELQVLVGSPDGLSAKTTPDMSFSPRVEPALPLTDGMGPSPTAGAADYLVCGSIPAAPALSFEGVSFIGQLLQRDHDVCQGAGAHGPSARVQTSEDPGGGLDAVLLRKIDKGNYSSQSHIIFRDRGSCQLLQASKVAPKLKAMERIVLEVQSGLRHGHVPEELSSSTQRDSVQTSISSLSPGDMETFELERASWWQKHLLSMNHDGDGERGPVTDFDYGELVQNCCGGTYMMRSSCGANAAVFKPVDEEPYAPRNPKGFIGLMDAESEMKPGVVVGGGAMRECAAFLLDHDGLASVPCTAMLRIAHTTLLADTEAEVQIKVGSLQRFQQHDCTSEDVGTARFDVTQAHAMGVLDVRIFNMDRNSDNVLVKMNSTNSAAVQLVPIDHGYILPSYKHLEEVHVCWLHWPQAKEPYGDVMLDYIAALDAEADIRLLRSTLALPEDSLLTLFIGTTLIQTAAANGLTLHETGMLMVRERPDCPSAVERVVAEAAFLADADCMSGAGMFDDFYACIKLHLCDLLLQLVLAHQLD